LALRKKAQYVVVYCFLKDAWENQTHKKRDKNWSIISVIITLCKKDSNYTWYLQERQEKQKDGQEGEKDAPKNA
jgi:hypothetical protein